MVQFVAAVLIVPQSPRLVAFSGGVFGLGVLLFGRMARRGVRRLEWLAARPPEPGPPERPAGPGSAS